MANGRRLGPSITTIHHRYYISGRLAIVIRTAFIHVEVMCLQHAVHAYILTDGNSFINLVIYRVCNLRNVYGSCRLLIYIYLLISN